MTSIPKRSVAAKSSPSAGSSKIRPVAKEPVIAIVGATGLVGNEMLVCLEQSTLKPREVRLFASEESVGEMYGFRGEELIVAAMTERAFDDVDIALFATSAELSAAWVPKAVNAGAIAIDNSSHFRLDPAVPLIVPEVNAHLLRGEERIIGNPNCSTIQLVPVLAALHRAAEIRRVVVTTFQSVSGAGKVALDELYAQTLAIFNQREMPQDVFPHQIAFNCIPQIDSFEGDGSTREELKIIHESRKILNLPELRITATAVRIPVFHCHSESVNIEFAHQLSAAEAKNILADVAGLVVHTEDCDYPMPIGVANTDDIHVGRIRIDTSVPSGLNLWIVADNVRKGAALNAVQIAQLVVHGRVQRSTDH